MPTTQAAVQAKLVSWARIQATESISDADQKDCVDGGLAEHNPELSYPTLPDNQVEPVVILAWIRLNDLRAGKVSQTNNTSTPGFGADRSTPFDKLMKFNEELRKRYDTLCARLGIGSSSASSIVVGNNRIKDARTGEQTPDYAAAAPPAVLLTQDLLISTELVVSWTFGKFDFFDSFILIQLTHPTALIYQSWNYTSTTSIPRINNSAIVIGQFYAQDLRSLKIEGIDRAFLQRFMVVARSINGLCTYSNELVIAIGP